MTDSSESESSGCESSESEKKDEPQMSMDEGCCICEISDATDVDPLVYCDDCNLAVHKLCYGIKDIPDGDWFCNICKYWKKKRSKDPLCDPKSCPLKCVLCDQDKGAMKELYKPPNQKDATDKWAHIVCALFIDEVLFQDIETSTGIIIDDISNDKKVGNHGRKCFFCTKMGFVVKCSCGKACDKWFHVTCAQRKQLLLMTDNNALAIESDRATEFRVFCSTEKLKDMKEKKQQESQRLKALREKDNDKSDDRRRKLSQEKILTDPVKNDKMIKLRKLKQASKMIIPGGLNPLLPVPKSGVKKQTTPVIDKSRKRVEKRKSTDETEKDKKRSKLPKEPKKEMIDLEENHLLDKSKKNMNILFEKFEAESVSIDTLDAPYLRFQQFVEFLKRDKSHSQLIKPVNQLWAMRQKEKQLNEKLASLRLTRQLMEKQIEMQEHFITYVIDDSNGYTNGYHEESEGELANGSVKSEADGDNLSTSSSTGVIKQTRPQLWYPENEDKTQKNK